MNNLKFTAKLIQKNFYNNDTRVLKFNVFFSQITVIYKFLHFFNEHIHNYHRFFKTNQLHIDIQPVMHKITCIFWQIFGST